jgi:hypothetical protein
VTRKSPSRGLDALRAVDDDAVPLTRPLALVPGRVSSPDVHHRPWRRRPRQSCPATRLSPVDAASQAIGERAPHSRSVHDRSGRVSKRRDARRRHQRPRDAVGPTAGRDKELGYDPVGPARRTRHAAAGAFDDGDTFRARKPSQRAARNAWMPRPRGIPFDLNELELRAHHQGIRAADSRGQRRVKTNDNHAGPASKVENSRTAGDVPAVGRRSRARAADRYAPRGRGSSASGV